MALSPIEERLARWRIVVCAALGTGCGETLLLSIGILPGWSHFGWIAGLMLLASLGFVDPLADRLRALLGLSAHGPVPRNAAERLLRGTIVGLIGLIAVSEVRFL